MDELSSVVFWILLGLALGQAALVTRFVWVLWHARVPQPGPFCPKVAVVLCLRGADPFLKATIRAMLRLDYPCYDVKIVVDRRDDPAWQLAEQTVAEAGTINVEIRSLDERRETCSLKCSSLLQAIGGLGESYEVVALLDADTIPHATWLRELVAPLADERVGAATGNRWYMPAEVSWGSLVRYLWNVAAVVQMFWYRIPWGGTLAIKTAALRQADIAQHWGRAFCEDTMLFRVMRDLGLKVAFVPSLMMVNREGGDMPGFFRWVTRQLLTARLYHPGWPLVLLHGVCTSLMMLAATGLCLFGSCTGHGRMAAWTGGGLAAYLAIMPLLILALELAVRRVVRTRGEPTNWLTPWTAMKIGPGIVLTQMVYAAALMAAVAVRRVNWRGVSYRVDGPWKIQLIEDRASEMDTSPGGSIKSVD